MPCVLCICMWDRPIEIDRYGVCSSRCVSVPEYRSCWRLPTAMWRISHAATQELLWWTVSYCSEPAFTKYCIKIVTHPCSTVGKRTVYNCTKYSKLNKLIWVHRPLFCLGSHCSRVNFLLLTYTSSTARYFTRYLMRTRHVSTLCAMSIQWRD